MDSEFDKPVPSHDMRMSCNDVITTVTKFKTLLEKFNHLPVINRKQGVSLFDVKADSMFSYLSSILYFMLRKCNGLSINDEESRARLGEIRVILEKIKPLELKLKYQIEKYLKMMNTDNSNTLDKSNFRARVENLMAEEDNETTRESNDEYDNNDEENGSEVDHDDELNSAEKPIDTKEKRKVAVYKPPKVMAVPYDDSNEEEKRKRKLEQSKKRALNTSIMQELREEYLDTPLEIFNAVTLRNKRSNFRQEKESYEETYFTRLPTTKKERHRDKLMSSLTVGNLGTEVTRFEDVSALEERCPIASNKRKMKISGKKKTKGFKKRRIH